jgi:hypothetical protein
MKNFKHNTKLGSIISNLINENDLSSKNKEKINPVSESQTLKNITVVNNNIAISDITYYVDLDFIKNDIKYTVNIKYREYRDFESGCSDHDTLDFEILNIEDLPVLSEEEKQELFDSVYFIEN